jgi:hypothetical protein
VVSGEVGTQGVDMKQSSSQTHSHGVNALLASGVMYWVLDLSRPGRTAVDWAVIGLVGLAIAWHLLQLGRRLHAIGGGRALWHLLRTLIFWAVGLHGVLAHSGPQLLGWSLVVLAVADSIAIVRKERSGPRPRSPSGDTRPPARDGP